MYKNKRIAFHFSVRFRFYDTIGSKLLVEWIWGYESLVWNFKLLVLRGAFSEIHWYLCSRCGTGTNRYGETLASHGYLSWYAVSTDLSQLNKFQIGNHQRSMTLRLRLLHTAHTQRKDDEYAVNGHPISPVGIGENLLQKDDYRKLRRTGVMTLLLERERGMYLHWWSTHLII